MIKALSTILVVSAVGLLVAHQIFASTITAMDCSASATVPLYDTPSGFMQDGYYDPVNKVGYLTDATSGKPITTAHILGSQTVEMCATQGKTYTYPITAEAYSDFILNKATLPAQDTTSTL